MRDFIDFSQCPVNKFKTYGGANGSKLNILYNSESYMLKFPSVSTRNKAISYTSSCFSEYIACHIFASLGIKSQETLLGVYKTPAGKLKVVVACKDFTSDGKSLMEFAQLKNSCIDSPANGYGTELTSIMDAIDEQALMFPDTLKNHFWEMFIADALLGNFDRHNGNWGLLVEEASLHVEIAPIYDCGSCLYPQASNKDMEEILANSRLIDERVYSFPTSAVLEAGKKVSYVEFISSHRDKDCTAALHRIAGRIDLNKINLIIDTTPGLSDVQRAFYKTMIQVRKEKIIDYSLKRAPQSTLKKMSF